jgi:hypothetical protein
MHFVIVFGRGLKDGRLERRRWPFDMHYRALLHLPIFSAEEKSWGKREVLCLVWCVNNVDGVREPMIGYSIANLCWKERDCRWGIKNYTKLNEIFPNSSFEIFVTYCLYFSSRGNYILLSTRTEFVARLVC